MTKADKAKTPTKKNPKFKSIRVSQETQEKIERVLSLANKKPMGRKVYADQALNLAIDLVVEDHIKLLQEKAMTNEDRKELLRQKYIETHGAISRDEFTGFMMKAEFSQFLMEHSH